MVERVIPGQYLEQVVPVEEAHQRLLLRAARGLGFGTLQDLADYYRMSPRDTRPRLEALVEMGKLKRGQVEGWSEEVFIDPEACTPRSISAQSLVSPFDPLIWYRQRLARLFDFDYRLEIFVSAGKRRWGYYVPPQPYGRTGLVVQPASSCRPNKMLRPISVSRVVEDAGYRLPPLSLTSTRKTRSQLARYFGIARLVLSAALANGVSMSSPVSSTALCQIPAGDLYQYQ